MSDFMSRLLDEKQQLDEKKDKLGGFLGSDKFLELSEKQQGLLNNQYVAMTTYSDILAERIEDLQ